MLYNKGFDNMSLGCKGDGFFRLYVFKTMCI